VENAQTVMSLGVKHIYFKPKPLNKMFRWICILHHKNKL